MDSPQRWREKYSSKSLQDLDKLESHKSQKNKSPLTGDSFLLKKFAPKIKDDHIDTHVLYDHEYSPSNLWSLLPQEIDNLVSPPLMWDPHLKSFLDNNTAQLLHYLQNPDPSQWPMSIAIYEDPNPYPEPTKLIIQHNHKPIKDFKVSTMISRKELIDSLQIIVKKHLWSQLTLDKRYQIFMILKIPNEDHTNYNIISKNTTKNTQHHKRSKYSHLIPQFLKINF